MFRITAFRFLLGFAFLGVLCGGVLSLGPQYVNIVSAQTDEPEGTDQDGIVPCGDNITVESLPGVFRYTGECAACHFQILIKRGLDFLIAFAVACAALLFANAGMLYATASASASNVSKAHKIFTSTLTGLVLILAAYLLIDVFMKGLTTGKFGPWNELLCKDFTPSYDVPKLEKIKLDSVELILPILPKVQCELKESEGGLGGTCQRNACLQIGEASKPVQGTNCPEGDVCCVKSSYDKYNSACKFKTSGFEDKSGTCTTLDACGDNHAEVNAGECGSGLICCEGVSQSTAGVCTSGPCSVENLTPIFGSEAITMSKLCKHESACSPTSESGTDICLDDNVFSVGLFQINLTVNKVGGLSCPNAFSGKNSTCRVKDQELYNKCKVAAMNPDLNLAAAKSLLKSGSCALNAWACSATKLKLCDRICIKCCWTTKGKKTCLSGC